jgi:hypothetical protein
MQSAVQEASASTLGQTGRLAWAERNAHSITVAAIYASALAALIAQEFVQDSWLAIAGGRDIVHHGLPWHERLTSLTHGQAWVDQQWLGKLFLFGVTTLGGIRLLALTHIVFVLGAISGAMVLARRRGASDSSVFWIAAAVLPTAPWAWQLRAQSISYVLFVAVIGLVAGDSEKRSAKVWLCLPIVALWANVHGSVALGAALVGLWGLVQVVRPSGPSPAGLRSRLRGLALLTLAPASLFASPYGLHLIHYYRTLIGNPLMARYVNEWRAPTLKDALAFFALSLGVTWLVARQGRVLSPFERLLLLVTGLAGLTAIRGIVWFGLAVVVLVPRLLDEERGRHGTRTGSRLVLRLAAACSALAVVILPVALAELPNTLGRAYPARAASIVENAVTRDRTVRVFASEKYADWLLWQDPRLSGRLVYDVRFELFSGRQFTELAAFHARGAAAARIADGARLLVLDRSLDAVAVRTSSKQRGATILYEDGRLVVILRPRE